MKNPCFHGRFTPGTLFLTCGSLLFHSQSALAVNPSSAWCPDGLSIRRMVQFGGMSGFRTGDSDQSGFDDGDDLIARARNRSPADLEEAREAFGRLFSLHGRGLWVWVSARVPRAEVDDVHQEIWLKVWEKLPTGYRDGCFRGWLFTLARNHLVDAARKRQIRKPFGYGGADAEPDDAIDDRRAGQPWEIAMADERRQRLADCIGSLEPRRRRLVVGRLGGETYESLAAELGIGVPLAQTWLFAAKKALRKCLGEE
jgi:RNA polymerase sigma-70 factor (ECF subfamily)